MGPCFVFSLPSHPSLPRKLTHRLAATLTIAANICPALIPHEALHVHHLSIPTFTYDGVETQKV